MSCDPAQNAAGDAEAAALHLADQVKAIYHLSNGDAKRTAAICGLATSQVMTIVRGRYGQQNGKPIVRMEIESTADHFQLLPEHREGLERVRLFRKLFGIPRTDKEAAADGAKFDAENR